MESSFDLPRVTDENYGQFVNAPGAMILFKIANCHNCEEYEPDVIRAAKEVGEKVMIGKALMHVPGACRNIKRLHTFDSYPTTHFYKSGKLVFEKSEKMPYEELREYLEEHFSI